MPEWVSPGTRPPKRISLAENPLSLRHFKEQDSRGVTQQRFEVVRTLKGAPEAEAALCFFAAFCVATIHLPASVQLPSLAGSVGFDYLDLQTSQRA